MQHFEAVFPKRPVIATAVSWNPGDDPGGGKRLTTQWSRSLISKLDDDEDCEDREARVRCVWDLDERARSLVEDMGCWAGCDAVD